MYINFHIGTTMVSKVIEFWAANRPFGPMYVAGPSGIFLLNSGTNADRVIVDSSLSI